MIALPRSTVRAKLTIPGEVLCGMRTRLTVFIGDDSMTSSRNQSEVKARSRVSEEINRHRVALAAAKMLLRGLASSEDPRVELAALLSLEHLRLGIDPLYQEKDEDWERIERDVAMAVAALWLLDQVAAGGQDGYNVDAVANCRDTLGDLLLVADDEAG